MDVPSEDDEDKITTEVVSSARKEPQIRHPDAAKSPKTETRVSGAQKSQTYKPSQRNPLYSGAENSCLWELNRLSRHYHPSVSHFAHTLMKVSCGVSVFYYPWLESVYSVTVCKYSIFFVAFFAKALIVVLENSRHFLNHLNKELKQTTTWSLPFSCSLDSLVFFALSY